MCLILFAYKLHPTYPLIVAANRDEFYRRPTAPANYWDDEPSIIAGRDLEKMGTWMGITTSARFAALTNYRDPNENTVGKHTRGNLVADFLKGNANPEEYLHTVAESRNMYPGYNLLVGDVKGLFYYSNVSNEVTAIQPGVYGLSNHLLNTNWPKVQIGKNGLDEIVKGNIQNHLNDEKMIEQLFELLLNAESALDELLPKTGVSLEMERILSPLFIKSEGYGTRSSTVLLMGSEHVQYVERIYDAEKGEERSYSFPL
ncbi:NRDE family protein [Bacillus sp. B15-48]|uniref:NRDE family protein n=1 Tax=Bacillus sp. B15-48 TaxID=1548601 RepID=UPI0019400511|nr:NRDE family protein [Bacillus sp. B15-48]MBM4764079.1 hypothetical protein [Bacillus sp. B15-48]